MTDMGWFITADAAEFLAEAGEFLHAEPARNTVVLTMAENLRVKAAAVDPTPAAAAPDSGPDDPLPAVDAEPLRLLLREIFTAAGGTHDDFGTYDRVMAAERRVAVLVTPARISPAPRG